MISLSIQQIEKGNLIAGQVLESLKKAMDEMKKVTGLIGKTAHTAFEQAKSMNKLDDEIKEISQAISDNSAVAEESSATSQELAAQSARLNELVQKFEF